MLFWEAEKPSLGVVHHLTVLCYHLQHPSLYSPEGLVEAQRLLVEFVEHSATTEEVRQRNRARVDSSQRTWKIKATAASHGAYAQSIHWTMTAADVTAGGANSYCDNVRRWAQSILETLQATQDLRVGDDPGQVSARPKILRRCDLCKKFHASTLVPDVGYLCYTCWQAMQAAPPSDQVAGRAGGPPQTRQPADDQPQHAGKQRQKRARQPRRRRR